VWEWGVCVCRLRRRVCFKTTKHQSSRLLRRPEREHTVTWCMNLRRAPRGVVYAEQLILASLQNSVA
jgi:hypothetical protein